MNKRLFSIFLLLIFCITPIFLTACNAGGDGFGGGDGDDTGGSGGNGGDEEQEEMIDLGDYFEGINTASTNEDNPSASSIVSAFMNLANGICETLLYEYGANIVAGEVNNIVADQHDTHAYAIVQDGWNWGVFANDSDVIPASELNTRWNDTTVIDYKKVLTYNLLCVVQGIEPLKLTGVADYQKYVNDGKFSGQSLRQLANPINHTGLHYYELDRIAEYILDEVIGKEVVARDNRKFQNRIGDGNADTRTFDSNEYFSNVTSGINDYINIVVDKTNTNLRSEETSRTTEWNSINWSSLGILNVRTQALLFEPSANDVRLTLAQFPQKQCGTDEFRQLRYLDGINLVYQPVKAELAEGVNPIYSGFKNYVNTIYYIVYSTMNTNIMSSFTLQPVAYIEDMHLSRVGVSNDNAVEGAFLTPAYQYKSLVLKAKQALTISYLEFWFELDPSIKQEVKIEVKGRYQYCTTSHTHYHTELCEFEIKEYSFGIVTIKPGTFKTEIIMGDTDNLFSGEASVEEIYLAGGGLEFDLTEPNEEGKVEMIHLSKFQAPIIDPITGVEAWRDGFVAAPADSFLSSLFQYRNDRSEFLEFCFNVVDGPSDAKFKFALFQLEIDTGE